MGQQVQSLLKRRPAHKACVVQITTSGLACSSTLASLGRVRFVVIRHRAAPRNCRCCSCQQPLHDVQR